MAKKTFLVGTYRIVADVTVAAYPETSAGDIRFAVTEITSTKPMTSFGFSDLTSGERAVFYAEVTAFACTLPHGFPSLRPLADAPMQPGAYGAPFLA